jgi:peptide/nickel transport system permease protein
LRTVVRRLIQLVVVVIVVTFFTSVLTALLPGDPITTIAPFATPEEKARLRKDAHLDENIVVRYKDWATDFFTGDLGTYYAGIGIAGQPVSNRAKDALPKSLLLIVYIELLTILVAVPLGVLMAYRSGTWIDQGSSAFVFLLLAVPTFVAAAIFKLWLGVKWDLFPTVGWTTFTDSPSEHFKHVIMPVLAVGIGQIAIYSRLLRSDMVATLQEDYILMAKSKGITNRRILWTHALRPSSLTLLTVAGLNIGALIGGLLIVERIFGIPGVGSQIYDAIQQRQYIALQSFVAIVAIVYVLVNFFVDILYTVIDPRIRSARIA